MNIPPTQRSVLCALLLSLGLAGPLFAHVTLDSPNGGEQYGPGSRVRIEWHVHIAHSTVGWDLEYSLNGTAGPWLPIAMGLPPGAIHSGAAHGYDWIVPLVQGSSVRVRVRQVNVNRDYTDFSNGDFGIGLSLAAQPFALSVNHGGQQTLSFDAGSSMGNASYLVAGSASGQEPGIPFGAFTVPLNPDFYFDFSISPAASLFLANSAGSLDAQGRATITLNLPAGALPPSAAGARLHHAGVVVGPGGQLIFVTTAAPLDLTL